MKFRSQNLLMMFDTIESGCIGFLFGYGMIYCLVKSNMIKDKKMIDGINNDMKRHSLIALSILSLNKITKIIYKLK